MNEALEALDGARRAPEPPLTPRNLAPSPVALATARPTGPSCKAYDAYFFYIYLDIEMATL